MRIKHQRTNSSGNDGTWSKNGEFYRTPGDNNNKKTKRAISK